MGDFFEDLMGEGDFVADALIDSLCSPSSVPNEFIAVKDVLKIIDRDMKCWKEGQVHPLLYCKCTPKARLIVHYYDNGKKIQLKCQQNKSFGQPGCGVLIWPGKWTPILNHIAACVGRTSVNYGWFDPLNVRLIDTIGYPLIEHANVAKPDFFDASERTSIKDDQGKDVMPGDYRNFGIFFPDMDSLVPMKNIIKWSTEVDERAYMKPALFEGYPPSEAEVGAVRWLCQNIMLSKTNPLLPVAEFIISQPSATTNADKNARYTESLLSMTEQHFLITSTNFFTRNCEHFDYVLLRGNREGRVLIKFDESWKFQDDEQDSTSGERIAIPLHGMGDDDLEWLYGMADWVLIGCREKYYLCNMVKLRRHIVEMAKSQNIIVYDGRSQELRSEVQEDENYEVSIQKIIELNAFESDADHHDTVPEDNHCGYSCRLDKHRPPNPSQGWRWMVGKGIFKATMTGGQAHDQYLIFDVPSFETYGTKYGWFVTL